MESDLEALREVEKQCLRKINLKAKQLMAADPRLKLELARAQACMELPQCGANYSAARLRLAKAGVMPLGFDQV